MDLDEFQQQTQKTNIYGEAANKLLMPIREALSLVEIRAEDQEDLNKVLDAYEALGKVHQILIRSYVLLGLLGEAGEAANKLKKWIRDGELPDGFEDEVLDIGWYWSQLVREIGLTLNTAAEKLLHKLFSRQERGKLGGSGDDR